MTASQYEVARKAAIAECFPKAEAAAQSHTKALQKCEAFKQLYGEWNVLTYMKCQVALDSNRVTEQVFTTAMVGCLADKGWIEE